MKTRGFIVVVLCALLAGCASGSGDDDKFIAQLEKTSAFKDGVPASDRDTLIEMAQQWCDFIEAGGRTNADVADAVRRMAAATGRISLMRDTIILGVGARVYCPEAASRLSSS